MITALDHFVLLTPDAAAARTDMQMLLGLAPTWRGDAGGTTITEIRTPNTAIELVTPPDMGDMTPGLKSLVFASDDIEGDHRLFTRRGLEPDDIVETHAEDTETGAARSWKRFRLPDANCHGVKTFIMQRAASPAPAEAAPGSATGLDHIVINTPNPERAIAHYGARLGLDFRLDRTAEQWKTRFLFFMVGGVKLEIIHRLDQDADPSGPDSIWGLTWETDDLEAANTRFTAAGRNVSELRTGRKPGSRVFTVRDGTLGVPTLFISHERKTVPG